MGWALACGPSGSSWRWVDDSNEPRRSPEVEELRRRRVYELRQSQADMARRLGMDVVSFSKAENGRTAFTEAQLERYQAVVNGR